ncbi:MAG TPA: 16S rRNA (cytosine(1402)-N(4))-methyltransferase RsmH [Burkholderiaceae bacterium]|nr:16S rRNA (cytosine(1402)-N(4))-methyltransferase RsmH [Burkholderiaceae bacterium]
MSSPAPSNAPGHRPVMLEASVTMLVTDPQATYVDATYGRGGHARRILQQLGAGGRLIALDRDPDAARDADSIRDARFEFVRTRFSRLSEVLDARSIPAIGGLLMDLGVSSPQLDEAARGFSLRVDGPLDMRMDPDSGQSVAEWLARADVAEVRKVVRELGDERFASSIAKAIVARQSSGRPVERTGELAEVVARAIPVKDRKDPSQHPATRTFQALRIFINQELEELALTLERSVLRMAPGARLVVISFHSLEDRIVKRFIDSQAHPERALARIPLRAAQLPQALLRPLQRLRPDAAEIAGNPRARSAMMRVAERTGAAAAAH